MVWVTSKPLTTRRFDGALVMTDEVREKLLTLIGADEHTAGHVVDGITHLLSVAHGHGFSAGYDCCKETRPTLERLSGRHGI